MQFTYWLLISAGLIDSDREGIILPARSLKPPPPISCHRLFRWPLISDSGKIIMHFILSANQSGFWLWCYNSVGSLCVFSPSLFGQYLIWNESYWDWASCCFIDFFYSCFEPGTERGELGWHVQCRADTAERLTPLALIFLQKFFLINK